MDQGKNSTFADKVLAFYKELAYTGELPAGVSLMNPYRDNPATQNITKAFYTKYFSDNHPRWLILGINPGRFGAGITGITFTDTIRLEEKCGIRFDGPQTYEPSSAFVYEMIDACGGVLDFYGKFLISAVCPLGFTVTNHKGKTVNYNYYDSRELLKCVYDFILNTLRQQLEFGINRNICFCLGKGKNEQFLRQVNVEHRFFREIIALEHPRYIMQYKAKSKPLYIRKYQEALRCS